MMVAMITAVMAIWNSSRAITASALFTIIGLGPVYGQSMCGVNVYDEESGSTAVPCISVVHDSIAPSVQMRYVKATHEVIVAPENEGTHLMPKVKLEVYPTDLSLHLLDTTDAFGQYDLVEVSILFPEALDTMFRNHFMSRFIHEWSSVWGAGEPAAFPYCDTCTLNPFDPDEVDAWVISERWDNQQQTWVDGKRTNGFYYVDFKRTIEATPPYMEHDSLGKFNWTPLPDEPQFIDQLREFRGRIAFADTGTYRLTAMSWADGFHQSEPVIVQVAGSSSKGYVQVDPVQERHLVLGNGELHFPCGPNLQANARRSKVPLANPGQIDYVLVGYTSDCTEILQPDSLDWCKTNETIWAVSEYSARPLHQAFFLVLHDELDQLQQAGVKSCRIMAQPWSFELEYQTLGDYSPSMHRAWELDELLRKARDTDVIIQWNLQGQSPFVYDYFNHRHASWGDGESNSTKDSYCYHDELDSINHPIDFFKSNEAQKWYRKKLRYFFARYGWSLNIGVVELFSEISGIEFQSNDTLIVQPYEDECNSQHLDYVESIRDWQINTMTYLRDTLDVHNHPIAVSYLSNGVNALDSSPDFADVYCQSCYTTDYLDIASSNQEPINQQSLERPAYCSELGFGKAVRSEMGKLNVQLLQSKATAARRAGAGFDWFSTTGVESGLLETQGLLTDYAISSSELLNSQINAVEGIANFEWFSSDNDSAFSIIYGNAATAQGVISSGIIFNETYSHVQALDFTNESILTSLSCFLDEYTVTDFSEDYLSFAPADLQLTSNFIQHLLPGSFVFDPVTHEQWNVDSISTNGLNTESCLNADGSHHLFFYFHKDNQKSTSGAQFVENSPIALDLPGTIGIGLLEKQPELSNDCENPVIHPNPATIEICAKSCTPELLTELKCYIFDLHGKHVAQWSSCSSCLPVAGLLPGIYLMHCSDGAKHKIAIQ